MSPRAIPDTLLSMSSDKRRSLPARRVYYDWDAVSTNPDHKLGAAFDHTRPGADASPVMFEEETTVSEWMLPALLTLVGGFFLGRWWVTRDTEVAVSSSKTTAVGCGFDLLGAA